jgi:DNA gyrase subunit A
MIQKTAGLVHEGKITGFSELRDESDRNGMRIVYELKRDAIPNVVLNKLYKYTALQTSFSINNIALVKGRPDVLNLKDMIHHFVEHRHDVVVRRTKYELRKAEERAHILEGLIIASDNIDEVIKIIRASKNADEARENLITRFNLSEIQSKAIVEMRLRQLTGLEQDKLRGEYDEIMKLITNLKDILDNEPRRMQIIKDEMAVIRDKYGDERRSIIEYSANEMRIEDLIPDNEVVITISHAGYIKRTNLDEYKVQNRGGVGSKGSTTRDKDFLEHLFVATNHNYLLVFTEKGKCFWMRVFEVPEGAKATKGRAIQNLINIEQDDKVKAYINVGDVKSEDYIKRPATQEDVDNELAENIGDLVDRHYIIMCTKKGVIKKTKLEAYSRPRTNGIHAIGVRDGDTLLEAKLTNGSNQIMMALKSGKSIRFEEEKVRSMGRTASGVRGIRLKDDKDEVIGMICVNDMESSVLVVSENGYGKRSSIQEYRITNRGGKGVKTINITEKTGNLIELKNVTDEDDLMVINKSGITIRIGVDTLREMGRATQGVKIIRLRDNDSIASVAKVSKFKEEEGVELDEEGNPIVTEETPENSDIKNETNLEENSENSNNEEENTEDSEETTTEE